MSEDNLDQGGSRPSLFWNLDPRTLLLAAMGSAICFSLIQSISVLCVCLALALLLLAAGKPSLLFVLKRLAVANFFILLLWLTVPFVVPGESLLSFGFLDVSREGFILVLSVSIKCNAIVLCFLAFISGLSLPLIGCSLERLFVPEKFVFLFLFTCRYIDVIGEEWQKLQSAVQLRGFSPRSSWHTYRTIGNLLGLTVVNSFDRSQRIYEAMLLRGFTGTFQTVTELKAARGDIVFTILFFLILACLLLADGCWPFAHV